MDSLWSDRGALRSQDIFLNFTGLEGKVRSKNGAQGTRDIEGSEPDWL
jgi:hypothetical protein